MASVTASVKTSPKVSKGKVVPEFVRKPIDTAALDQKYSKPELFGKFTVYFGKHKGCTFQDLLKQQAYCDWVLKSPPFTNNMYLFQRYLKHKRSKASPTLEDKL